MQELNPSFIVRLGAIPQPILAAVALMTEFHHAEAAETHQQSADDLVDIEHMVKENPYSPHSTTKE